MRKVVEMMNCEEFELRGLDVDRADGDPQEILAARKHAEVCDRCRALLESWREVKGDLRILRESTRLESAPARVEMRLKQELRTRREARVPRSAVAIAGWALAAAAVLVASIGWMRTHNGGTKSAVDGNGITSATVLPNVANQDGGGAMLAVDFDSGEFTQLPGSLPGKSDDAAILQVRMQRGALQRFGFPVEQDRASELVDVDFLVGEDGQPQAVRLHQDAELVAVAQ